MRDLDFAAFATASLANLLVPRSPRQKAPKLQAKNATPKPTIGLILSSLSGPILRLCFRGSFARGPDC